MSMTCSWRGDRPIPSPSMCGGNRPRQTPAEAEREDADARHRAAVRDDKWPDLSEFRYDVTEPPTKPAPSPARRGDEADGHDDRVSP